MWRRRYADTPQTLTQTLPQTLIHQDGFKTPLSDGKVLNINLGQKAGNWSLSLESNSIILCWLGKLFDRAIVTRLFFDANKSLAFFCDKYRHCGGEWCGTSFFPLQSPRVLRGNSVPGCNIVPSRRLLCQVNNLAQPPGSIIPNFDTHVDMVGSKSWTFRRRWTIMNMAVKINPAIFKRNNWPMWKDDLCVITKHNLNWSIVNVDTTGFIPGSA